MNPWKPIVMGAVFVAMCAFGSTRLSSAQEGKSIEQMIAGAKTPADHEAIATYYEKEAQAAHKKHAEHQGMSDSYATIPVLRIKTDTVAHCKTIAKRYADIAKEYEDLATLHRGMAKSSK
jgi:hypothetical protein